MKKIILASMLALLLFPSAAFASFDTNLRYGSRGEQVRELQEFLTEQGVYNGPITGNFYALTLQAVKKFQTVNKIQPASGFFGVLSRTKANTILTQQLEESEKEAASEPVVPAPTSTAPVLTPPPPVVVQPVPSPTPIIPTPMPTQPVAAPQPVEPVVQPQPVSQAKLELFNPVWIKGIRPGAEYKAASVATTEDNYVYVGLVVTAPDGANDRLSLVEVVATDATQSRVMNGTGHVLGQSVSGFPAGTYYYGYTYEFHTSGDHTVTFKVHGLEKSFTINVK